MEAIPNPAGFIESKFGTKKCNRCRETRPLCDFHRDNTKPGGHYTICKDCRAGRSLLPEIPTGYRQCRICDKIKPDTDFYPASEGVTRRTCKDCSDGRWVKSYRATPGNRPGHHIQSLFGYLSDTEKTALQRNNPEVRRRVRATDRKYKRSRRGQHRRREWVSQNRDRLRMYSRARQAQKRKLKADFTVDDWAKTLEAFNNRCAYCGTDKEPLAQDHWIPLARGGPYTLGNIVPACKSCNSAKRDKLPQDFCEMFSLLLSTEKILKDLSHDANK